MTLVGMLEEDLQNLITQAYKRGYHECWDELHATEWLNGRDEIIAHLSDGGPRMSVRSFQEHRRAGHFGDAIIGVGESMRARRAELDAAYNVYLKSKY